MNDEDFKLLSEEFKRPHNETQEDRDRETLAAQQVGERWGCDVRKLDDRQYGIDWSLWKQEELVGWAEFKWRGNERYPSLLIGCLKVWRLIRLSAMTNVSASLFVRWNDGLWCTTVHSSTRDQLGPVRWEGNSRGQPGDKEPCYFIDMRYFKRVCD